MPSKRESPFSLGCGFGCGLICVFLGASIILVFVAAFFGLI